MTKFYLFTLAFLFTFIFESKADSDTLLVNLKSGSVEEIALSDIKNIKFENVTGVREQTEQAGNLAIKGNYPNPFVEQTSIEFDIEQPGKVEIFIYDVSGNLIQKLKCENCQAGKNSLPWNCLNKNNEQVQSGIYFYEVHFGNEVLAKKMIMVRGGK